MTFGEILNYLNEGYPVRRMEYDPALIIFKQVPASIDDVSSIKSIPEHVKALMTKHGVGIDYENQYIVYDFITGTATYCIFDGDDIAALDWVIVGGDYDPYE